MNKWLRKKPVWFAVLVALLNMELVVIPLILKGFFHLGGWPLKIGSAVWTSVEVIFWYWFAGWVAKKLKESRVVGEALAIGKESMPEIKNMDSEIRNIDFVKKAEDWVYVYVIEPFNPGSQKAKRISFFLKSIGYIYGLPIMFFSGLLPFFWVPSLAFCVLAKWRLGFAVVILGNIIKNMFFAGLWDFVWKFF